MKRVIAVVLLLTALLSLNACAFGKDKIEQYAKAGWQRIGEKNIELDKVYVMQYTSRRNLLDQVLDTPMYFELPENGYAVLYHSYVSADPFSDSFACFFDGDGNLKFTFDYEEYDQLFEKYYSDFSMYNMESGEKALEYISDCNYISGMINHANSGEVYSGDMEKNVWYCLTEDQIDRIS